jgi:hypothetical protein
VRLRLVAPKPRSAPCCEATAAGCGRPNGAPQLAAGEAWRTLAGAPSSSCRAGALDRSHQSRPRDRGSPRREGAGAMREARMAIFPWVGSRRGRRLALRAEASSLRPTLQCPVPLRRRVPVLRAGARHRIPSAGSLEGCGRPTGAQPPASPERRWVRLAAACARVGRVS